MGEREANRLDTGIELCNSIAFIHQMQNTTIITAPCVSLLHRAWSLTSQSSLRYLLHGLYLSATAGSWSHVEGSYTAHLEMIIGPPGLRNVHHDWNAIILAHGLSLASSRQEQQ